MMKVARILFLAALIPIGCASLPGNDPPQVTIVSVDPIEGEALELRMLVKLRVVNPNDQPIDYDGVYVKLAVQGYTVATGVSDEKGTVPRFGEAVIPVRVNVSIIDVARHALQAFNGGAPEQLQYHLEGKLNGPLFGSTRFQSDGSFSLKPQ
jgi:LEA14-like dessication related protein